METRRWTLAAKHCYDRHCICEGCLYSTLETGCYMKGVVLELYQKFGKPKKENRLRKFQLKITEHYGSEIQKEKLVKSLQDLETALIEKKELEKRFANVLNLIQGLIALEQKDAQVEEIQMFQLEHQIQKIYRDRYKEEGYVVNKRNRSNETSV